MELHHPSPTRSYVEILIPSLWSLNSIGSVLDHSLRVYWDPVRSQGVLEVGEKDRCDSLDDVILEKGGLTQYD